MARDYGAITPKQKEAVRQAAAREQARKDRERLERARKPWRSRIEDRRDGREPLLGAIRGAVDKLTPDIEDTRDPARPPIPSRARAEADRRDRRDPPRRHPDVEPDFTPADISRRFAAKWRQGQELERERGRDEHRRGEADEKSRLASPRYRVDPLRAAMLKARGLPPDPPPDQDLTLQAARDKTRSLPGHMLNDPEVRRKIQEAGIVPTFPGGKISETFDNLGEAAIYAPAGVYEIGKATTLDSRDAMRGDVDFDRSRRVAKAVAESTAHTIRHPLDRPGDTLLLGWGGLGAAAGATSRLSAAGRQIAKGAGAKQALKAKPYEGGSLLHKPLPGVRTQTHRDLEIRDRYALNPALAFLQKGYDKTRERLGADPTRRVSKLVAEERRITDAVARAPADALRRAGRRLTAPQRMALRVYNEGVPLEQVIARHRGWLDEAVGQRRRDLQHKLGLLEASARYLDVDDGKPVLRDAFKQPRKRGRKGVDAPGLQGIADRIDRVAGEHPGGREALLNELGLLTDAQSTGRRNAPGRLMLGAEFVREGQRGTRGQRYIDLEGKQLPARTSSRQREMTEAEAQARIDHLEDWVGKRVDVVYKAMQSDPALRVNPVGPDKRPRREYRGREPFQIGRHGPESAEYVEPPGGMFKPIQPRSAEQAKAATRQKADALIDKHGRKENAHPMLKQIVERMDELDALKAAMLQRAEGALGDQDAPRLPLGNVEEITSVRVPRRYGTELGRKDKGRLVGAEDFQGGRQRIPDTPMVQRPAANRPQVFRGGVPKKPASLTHTYTGELRRSGNYRTDTDRLVAESALEAQRYASVERLRQRVIQAAVDEKPDGDGFVPVRTKMLTPTESRRLQDLLARTERAVDNMTPEERQAAAIAVKEFVDNAFPALGQFAHVLPGQKVNGVVWIEKQLVDGVNRDAQRALMGVAGRYFDTAQNAVKASILFADPTAYVAANAAGNALFNIAQQGVLAPVNWAHAARISKDPDLAAWIDGAAGGGFVRSVIEGSSVRGGLTGQLSSGLENVGNLLGLLSDSVFRRAAFLHEARRYGFKSDAELRDLFTNSEYHGLLTEISGRARSAIVDYERMGPFERDVLRRAIFVYPWVKGSTLYAGHFIGEHPVQAAVLSQLAQVGQEQAQKDLGDVPSYARGVFKVGGSRDRPMTVNPSSLNPFATPAQLGRAALSGFTGGGGSADKPIEVLSPFLSASLEAATGRSTLTGAPQEGGLPGLVKNLAKTSAPGTLVEGVKRSRGDQSDRTYPAKTWQVVGRFGLGSWFPRDASRQALNEQAARDREGKLSPGQRATRRVFEQRRSFFTEAQRVAPEMVRDGKMSERVRRSFDLEAQRQRMYADVSKGRKSGSRGYHLARYMADLTFLAEHGQIERDRIAALRTQAETATVDQLKEARRGISERYYQGEGGQLYWIGEARKYLKERGGVVD